MGARKAGMKNGRRGKGIDLELEERSLGEPEQ